ncbi:MAG: hypothetical protein IKN38_08865 [Clostridia bacterium]|nr:hypothetical protein [Clostridia bacterium]
MRRYDCCRSKDKEFQKERGIFPWALRKIADSYSALGVARKEQTYKACGDNKSIKPSGVYYDGVNDYAWYVNDVAKNYFKDTLVCAVSDFSDKTGNPVVTSERFKNCERQLAGLE